MKRNRWAVGAGVVVGFVVVVFTTGHALIGLPFRYVALGVLVCACAVTAVLVTGRGQVGSRHDAWRGVGWGALCGAVVALALLIWFAFLAVEMSEFE
jgi:hypothetical protein